MPGGIITSRFGFRLIAGGQTYYGWADVTVAPETLPSLLAAAQIPQWAYQSQPNAPMTVGVLPELTSAGAARYRAGPA